MANRLFTQFNYSLHKAPVSLDCNFIVDSANGNGLGIRSLKGPGIKSVFMHTSAPLSGSGNPNPESGIIEVILQDNYFRYFTGFSGFASPLSGTPISISAGLTLGHPYIITSLGTSTQANFQALGLPSYITAAPGVSFIATSASAGTGTGTVQAPLAAGSGIDHIEVIGDPNLMNSSSPTSGMSFILACYKNGVLTAPTDGATISLAFSLSNSSIIVQGE